MSLKSSIHIQAHGKNVSQYCSGLGAGVSQCIVSTPPALTPIQAGAHQVNAG